MVICRRAVFGSSLSVMVSFVFAPLISFWSSDMFMQSFVGSLHVYWSKFVFGIFRFIIATLLGSMDRSWMFSGVMLKVASSIRVFMIERVCLRNCGLVVVI